MKKTSLILIIALLVGLMAFQASAAEAGHPHRGDHCVCGGSAVSVHDHSCANIKWQAMPTDTKDFAKLADGNYYLTKDMTITDVTSFTGKKLTICLNGYDINTSASAIFGYAKQGSVINICDCSGSKDAQGNWTWGGTITGNQSGKGRTYGGLINMNSNTTLNVYGGNYVGPSAGTTKQGGIFNISNDCHGGSDGNQYLDIYDTNLNIYNGHFTGGSVTSNGGVINSWHYVHVNLYGGTIMGGTGKTRGNLNISANTTMIIENCTIIGGNPSSVLVMNGTNYVAQYPTLTEALSKVKTGEHIRLLGDINEAVTIPSGVCIDLAGNDLSGVTVENGAQFIDSTTDSYKSDLAGSLIPAAGTPSLQNKYNSKQYLALESNGAYSFHRFYAGITKITLKPSTVGFGYKATFAGSDEVKAALSSSTAYGYRMWLSQGNKIDRGYSASRFGGTQEVTLRIDNFLDSALTATENESRATQQVSACAYLRLTDGTYIESAPVSYSFREMLELTNQNYANFSETQQNALLNLSAQFSGSMISWDIHNIHHAEGSCWQKMTNASFNKLLSKNSTALPTGNYVLTEDVDLTYEKFKITSSSTVNICLNGYTLSCKGRMFNNWGNLSFCDCHAPDEEGTASSALEATTTEKYAGIVYGYYNSVTNLYGGTLMSTKQTTDAGVIAVSHDGSSSAANKPAGIFNMYGGKITGGNVTKYGGNVALWNGSTFNYYDGIIEGGSSGTHSGNIHIGSKCVMNMYGGTITGGSSTTSGGNIYNTGTLNIYGGLIENGNAGNGKGSNIYSSGTLNMYGGTVTGGTAIVTDEDGNQLYQTGGGVDIVSSTAYITGNTVIDGNNDKNLYIKGLSRVNIEKLTPGAKIDIYADSHDVISTDPGVLPYITTNQEGYEFYNLNGKILMKKTDYTPGNISPVSTFSVGYSITSIHPTESGLQMSAWGNPNGRTTDGTSGYELYATTVAVTDEQNNTFLMITVDLQGNGAHKDFRKRISVATGVPETNIYISATHTHNCPSLTTSNEKNARYVYMVAEALVEGSLDAMADRTPATMETGSFDTVGLNWTRHYYYYANNDTSTEKIYYGDQFGQAPKNGETVYRVRQTDNTMHMVVFRRDDKQPVLITNWRAHPHRSGGREKYSVDSDVIGATRDYIHTNTDYLFAYYQGAAGNVNTTSRISGETYQSGKIKEFGNEMGRQILNGMANLKPAETGLIQTTQILYQGEVDHSQDDKYEDAVALKEYYYANPVEMNVYANQIAKAAEYGFTSVFHATRLITKYELPATKELELNIFSIGNSVGFYTAPAELWDSFSEELEGESPFETTFCIGYCNGGVAYIPYKLDYYVAYEYFYCLFTQDDTINQMKEYYLENLEKQYENAQ